MVNLIFNYLLESSICLILFTVTYRILVANTTNFSWMRFYLLVSMALSLLLPFIIIPIEWSARLLPTTSMANTFLIQAKQTAGAVVNNNPDIIPAHSGISILQMILFIAFTAYMIGIIYKSYLFVRNLIKINGLIKKSSKVKEENYWLVCLKGEIPAFSFFNYIFINNNYKDLSSGELHVIKQHEMVHVKQYHTLDILFAELIGIIFWFNPIINYLKKSLKEVHEYIVDERIAGNGENKKAYAQLLLSLASDTKAFDLAASFTGEHIKRRLEMIAKPRTSRKHKFLFIILVPLTAFLLLSFSYFKNPKTNSNSDSYREQNEAIGSRPELKKYCGIYFPSKNYASYLKPIEIILRDNKLFRLIQTEPESANRMVELHFEADSLFSYADNSARTIAFDLDNKKEVRGCAFLKFETRGNSNYLILEGKYSKQKTGK
ncbi:MAG: M56 family metallopeptidase [Bacteroidota bacterium]